MSPLPSRDSINRFFVLSGLWVTLHVSVFTTQQAYSTLAVALWTLATTVSYAFLYLLPALLPGYLPVSYTHLECPSACTAGDCRYRRIPPVVPGIGDLHAPTA